MKSKAALFWLLASVILGIALAERWSKARKQRTIIESLQLKLEKATEQNSAASLRLKKLETELEKSSAELLASTLLRERMEAMQRLRFEIIPSVLTTHL